MIFVNIYCLRLRVTIIEGESFPFTTQKGDIFLELNLSKVDSCEFILLAGADKNYCVKMSSLRRIPSSSNLKLLNAFILQTNISIGLLRELEKMLHCILTSMVCLVSSVLWLLNASLQLLICFKVRYWFTHRYWLSKILGYFRFIFLFYFKYIKQLVSLGISKP